jgi:4-hydroxybenzoate polyprenyltransferase
MGDLSLSFAWAFLAASCLLFFISALWNRLALAGGLALLLVLSYCSPRVSWSPICISAPLACPLGAWIAIRATFDAAPLLLAGSYPIAGFDVIYSCQDIEFDRRGPPLGAPALRHPGVARSPAMHAGMIALLLVLPMFRLGGA